MTAAVPEFDVRTWVGSGYAQEFELRPDLTIANAETIFGTAGTAVRDAQADVDEWTAHRSQIAALRESVSGTSSDDEMVALMSYQRAYEASLRVVQVADDMLAQLVQLGKR